jgi:hypothetical protein
MQQPLRQYPGFSSDSFVTRSPKLIRYPHLGTGDASISDRQPQRLRLVRKHVAHELGSPMRGVDHEHCA